MNKQNYMNALSSVMTEDAAKHVIRAVVNMIGKGYHPSNTLDDYCCGGKDDLTRFFTDEQVAELTPVHDAAL